MRHTLRSRFSNISVYVIMNGLALFMGLWLIFAMPDVPIGRFVVAVFCLWNYLLGWVMGRMHEDL